MRNLNMTTDSRTASNKVDRRKHPRFVKRLSTKFLVDHKSFMGISSDLSENGLFIRTNRGLNIDSTIDIELLLPDNRVSFLKGIVRRTKRTPISSIKNGMGIEIIEKDSTFIDFIKSIGGGKEANTVEKHAPRESQIISCSNHEIPKKDLKNAVQERRWHKRFKVEHLKVTSEMPSATNVKIINISVSGVLVKVDRILNIGKKYALKIEYENQALFVKAAVVWSLLLESAENANDNSMPIYIAGMHFTDVLRGKIEKFITLLEVDTHDDICQPFRETLKVSL